MNFEQTEDCIRYFNSFFPEKGLPDATVKNFVLHLAPLDYEMAIRAIDLVCSNNPRPGFLPEWSQVHAAYNDVWRAQTSYRPATAGVLEPPKPTAEQRSLHERRHAVLMQLVREQAARQHSPAEQRRYVETRDRKRAECRAAGVEYLTELQERLVSAGLPARHVPSRTQTWRCLRCRDAGWVTAEHYPAGSAERYQRCSCGGGK